MEYFVRREKYPSLYRGKKRIKEKGPRLKIKKKEWKDNFPSVYDLGIR